MAWVRIDDSFDEHPKFLRAGHEAGWLFIRGLAWCNRQESDGHIPAPVIRQIGSDYGPRKALTLATTLVNVDLWHTPGHNCERCPQPADGWQIHDYLDYQIPRSKKEKDREAARIRMGKVRDRRRDEPHGSSTDVRGEHEPNMSQTRSYPVPVPVPVPEETHTPASSLEVNPPDDTTRKQQTDQPGLPTLPRDIHDEAHAHQLPIDAYWQRVQTAVDRHRRDGATIHDPVAFGIHLARDNDPLLRIELTRHTSAPVATVTDLFNRTTAGKSIDEALA